MGCTASKPSSQSRPSRSPEPSFRPYTGPKEFRSSMMPERKPPPQHQSHHHPSQPPHALRELDAPEPHSNSKIAEPKPHRRADRMYHTYRELEEQRGAREERRYSWEGHPTERMFTTFEQLAERGVIPKGALKKK